MNKKRISKGLLLCLVALLLVGNLAFGEVTASKSFIETIYRAIDSSQTWRGISEAISIGQDAATEKSPEYDPVGDTEAMLDLYKALSGDTKDVSPATSELEQEISAALLELYGVNWKDLEHLMNIYNPIINANISVKGKTPIDTLVLALKQLYGDRWWKYLPIYPRSNNPEDLDHFSKVYPVEATIAVMKNHFGIELEGGIASNGIPDADHLWTPQQAFFAYWAVQQVPPFVSKYTKYIKRVTYLPSLPAANGYVIRGQPRIYMCNLGCYAGYFEKVLIHEMGHVWMFSPENEAVAREFIDTFSPVNGKIVGTLVSGYAGTNIYEDFAESFAYFWKDPLAMKKVSPLRFEFMLKKVFTYYAPNHAGHDIIKSKGTSLATGFPTN